MTRKTIKQFFGESKNIRIIRESIISSVLVFLLMGLVSPFNVDQLGDKRLTYFILISIATFFTGTLVGFFTTYVLQMPLDAKLPLSTVHRNSALLFLINIPVLSAVLTTLNGFYNCNRALDIWYYNGHFTLVPYTYFLYYVSSSSIFIYFGTYIRNKNWQLKEQLEEMRSINKLLEEHQQKLEQKSEIEDKKLERNEEEENAHEEKKQAANPEHEKRVCRLVGNTIESMLEVVAADIIYVESMANYATIWYLLDNTPTHKMLRITLKQIKEQLDELPYMAQCHRAFIVNLNFVVTMTNRNNGYQLQLFGTDKLIPVSRTYTPMMKEKLQG